MSCIIVLTTITIIISTTIYHYLSPMTSMCSLSLLLPLSLSSLSPLFLLSPFFWWDYDGYEHLHHDFHHYCFHFYHSCYHLFFAVWRRGSSRFQAIALDSLWFPQVVTPTELPHARGRSGTAPDSFSLPCAELGGRQPQASALNMLNGLRRERSKAKNINQQELTGQVFACDNGMSDPNVSALEFRATPLLPFLAG